MKDINKTVILIAILFASLTSCHDENAFSPKEMDFCQSLNEKRVYVYTSGNGNNDTITFYPLKRNILKVRSFPRGFYNEVDITVYYSLSKHSYHKFIDSASIKEGDRFLWFSRTTDGITEKEVFFFGILFDEELIDSLLAKPNPYIVFNRSDSYDSSLTVNEAINSFTYSYRRGVISYVDSKGNEWKRVN